MTKKPHYTTEQIESAISAALADGNMQAVEGLLTMLAVRDPHFACGTTSTARFTQSRWSSLMPELATQVRAQKRRVSGAPLGCEVLFASDDLWRVAEGYWLVHLYDGEHIERGRVSKADGTFESWWDAP